MFLAVGSPVSRCRGEESQAKIRNWVVHGHEFGFSHKALNTNHLGFFLSVFWPLVFIFSNFFL